MLRKPLRTTRWSSAIKRRIGLGLGMIVTGTCSAQWGFHQDFGPFTRPAFDGESRAHLFGAFTHAQQSKMRAFVERQARGIESLSVIMNAQHDAPRLVVHPDPDAAGPGVLERVGDGFLADA